MGQEKIGNGPTLIFRMVKNCGPNQAWGLWALSTRSGRACTIPVYPAHCRAYWSSGHHRGPARRWLSHGCHRGYPNASPWADQGWSRPGIYWAGWWAQRGKGCTRGSGRFRWCRIIAWWTPRFIMAFFDKSQIHQAPSQRSIAHNMLDDRKLRIKRQQLESHPEYFN